MKKIILIFQCFSIFIVSVFVGVFSYAIATRLGIQYSQSMLLDWVSVFVGFGALFFYKIISKEYTAIATKYLIVAIALTIFTLLKLVFIYFI